MDLWNPSPEFGYEMEQISTWSISALPVETMCNLQGDCFGFETMRDYSVVYLMPDFSDQNFIPA